MVDMQAFFEKVLFFSKSLQTIDAYFLQHNAFPKKWVDMQAFFEKVFFFSCFSLLHNGYAKVLQ
jgi:hypothetical protein